MPTILLYTLVIYTLFKDDIFALFVVTSLKVMNYLERVIPSPSYINFRKNL